MGPMHQTHAVLTATPPRQQPEDKHDINELASMLTARLQYAQLKVQTGMVDKNLQQIEAVLKKTCPLTPASPDHADELLGDRDREAAAARTIMLMSGESSLSYPEPMDVLTRRPHYRPTPDRVMTMEEYVAQDPNFESMSRATGRSLPRRRPSPPRPPSPPGPPTSSWLRTVPNYPHPGSPHMAYQLPPLPSHPPPPPSHLYPYPRTAYPPLTPLSPSATPSVYMHDYPPPQSLPTPPTRVASQPQAQGYYHHRLTPARFIHSSYPNQPHRPKD